MASGPPRSVDIMQARNEIRAAAGPPGDRTGPDPSPGRAGLYIPNLGKLARAFRLRKQDAEAKAPTTSPAAPNSLPSPVGESDVPWRSANGAASTAPAIPLERVPYEVAPPMRMRVVDRDENATAPQQARGGEGDPSTGATRARRDEEGGKGRYLFCIPTNKSRPVCSQILSCVVSGTVFIVVLGVYIGLSVSRSIRQSELSIIIILIILSSAIFFCFCAIRLWLLVRRPEPVDARRAFVPELASQYVVPPKPIPVVLAQDEEAVGIEGEAATSKPPAYGLWRETVRVDPNRLFWQRNENARPERTSSTPSRTEARPPSYASEDGVDYVLEAQPRSVAPPTTVYHSGAVRPLPSISSD